MPSRLVITPWDGNNQHFLDRCKQSVCESGIEHRVVRCGTDWEQVMFSMRDDADGVAWVDADDIVFPGVLTKAFDLLESLPVGLVYTDECRIDETDAVLRVSSSGEKSLWDLASHPRSIHHLTVTKKHAISERPLLLYQEIGVPLDWAMKVDAGANLGIAHLSMMGYGWRIHDTQITANPALEYRIQKSIQPARNHFREWVTGVKQY